MGARMVIKRVVLFGVVWLVSAVVTVGVLTAGARGFGGELTASAPAGGPGGWHYRRVQAARHSTCWWPCEGQPTCGGPMNRGVQSSFPAEPLADPEHSRRIFDDQGETLVIEWAGRATGFVGGVYDHPIFKTREEAERYRDALLASGSGEMPR